MSNLCYCFIFTALIVLSTSCNKENEEVVPDRDQFIGSYTGTMTSMLDANGVPVDYDIVPVNKTIEKGIADDEIIIGRGTNFEFNASVDGTIFLISGHVKSLTIGKDGIPFNVSISGQGVIGPTKELIITYTGTENYDDIMYKWTIVEKLIKDIEPKP